MFRIIFNVEHKRLLSIEKAYLAQSKELEQANAEITRLRKQVSIRDKSGKFCKK